MNSKRIFLIASLLCFIPMVSFSQNKAKELHAGGYVLQATTVDTSLNEMFVMCGEMPEFPGGTHKLLKYAEDFLYYPESAVKDSIQGRVLVQFMIDTTGKASYETIIESVRIDLDTICLSMIRNMPTWAPGKIGTEKVQVRFWWRINFVLNNKNK